MIYRTNVFGPATAGVLALALLACGSDVPSSPPATTSARQSAASDEPAAPGAGTILSIDFETYPLGPLGAPWGGTKAGSSTVTVVNGGKHGKVLKLDAGSTSNDWLSYSTSFTPTSNNITVEYDVIPASGASSIFELKASGYGLSHNTLRLSRSPGSTALTSPAGSCGTLVDGTWNHVVLDVMSASHTFTVKVNGASLPACTNAPTTLVAPYKGIGVFDPINVGYGGRTGWDNFLVH